MKIAVLFPTAIFIFYVILYKIISSQKKRTVTEDFTFRKKIETINFRNFLKYLFDFDGECKIKLINLISAENVIKTTHMTYSLCLIVIFILFFFYFILYFYFVFFIFDFGRGKNCSALTGI